MAEASLPPPFGLTGARRVVAIAAAAFVLTSVFVVTGFPYDRVASRVENAITAATGRTVHIGRMTIGLTWLVPELRGWDVDATLADGRSLHFDRIRVRPAWSLSWLHGAPALALALRAPIGEADGTLTLGSEPGYTGVLRDVQLGKLPIDALAPGTTLDGRASGDFDLRMRDGRPVGTAKLDAKQGSVTLPLLPIGVPYDSLGASVALGGDVLARIDSLDLAGPLVSLAANGTIGQAPVATAAPLALTAKLTVRDPSMRSVIGSQGVPLDANGEANVQIGGTLGAPEPRPAGAPRGANAPRAPR